jgi:hypothetical protein
MSLSVINEKELGEAIVNSLAPKLAFIQERFETWIRGLLVELLQGNAVRLTTSLGGQTVQVTVELVPKP